MKTDPKTDNRRTHKAALLAFVDALESLDCADDTGLRFWRDAALVEPQRQLGKLASVKVDAVKKQARRPSAVPGGTELRDDALRALTAERNAAVADATKARAAARAARQCDVEVLERLEALERENARLRAELTATAPWADEDYPAPDGDDVPFFINECHGA
jgi:hypothetical protein